MHPLFNPTSGAILSAAVLAGTAATLAAAGTTSIYLLRRGNGCAARWVAAGGAGIAWTYLVVLAGVSLALGGGAVERGAERYVGDAGRPLAYSVLDARRAETLGGARPSRGAWEVVTVRVRFDPSTARGWRGDAPLWPNLREARIIDGGGNRYAPSAAGLRALEAARGARTPLTRALRPGESYTATLVFDVPADARDPALLLAGSSPVARLLIGHERGLLRAPTLFRLDVSTPYAGSKS